MIKVWLKKAYPVKWSIISATTRILIVTLMSLRKLHRVLPNVTVSLGVCCLATGYERDTHLFLLSVCLVTTLANREGHSFLL